LGLLEHRCTGQRRSDARARTGPSWRQGQAMFTYASLRLQVVDACIVALAERLDLREVAALDRRDFQVVAPRHLPKLIAGLTCG
jgi:predicted nucleic acid-binding protein